MGPIKPAMKYDHYLIRLLGPMDIPTEYEPSQYLPEESGYLSGVN
jgi:hypothetical protein